MAPVGRRRGFATFAAAAIALMQISSLVSPISAQQSNGSRVVPAEGYCSMYYGGDPYYLPRLAAVNHRARSRSLAALALTVTNVTLSSSSETPGTPWMSMSCTRDQLLYVVLVPWLTGSQLGRLCCEDQRSFLVRRVDDGGQHTRTRRARSRRSMEAANREAVVELLYLQSYLF